MSEIDGRPLTAAEEAEQALRRFLNAFVLRPGSALSLCTGAPRKLEELRSRVDFSLVKNVDPELLIKSVELDSIDDGEARFRLDAVATFNEFEHDGSERRGASYYGGPAALLKQNGEWKVMDLVREGRSLTESVVEATGTGSGPEAISGSALGAFLGSDATAIYTSIEIPEHSFVGGPVLVWPRARFALGHVIGALDATESVLILRWRKKLRLRSQRRVRVLVPVFRRPQQRWRHLRMTVQLSR